MKYLTVLLFSLLTLACTTKQMQSGIDLPGMDKNVMPQQDFFRYVNGTWLEKTEIPADKSNYGIFTALADQAREDLKVIIEEAAAGSYPAGSDKQKVGDFYLSFLDTTAIEAKGLKPLQAELAAINQLTTKEELVDYMVHLRKIGVQTPVAFFVAQDLKQSDRHISFLNQSGTGLPDRDYYFKADQKFAYIRLSYVRYIADLFALAGMENGAVQAEMILKLETALAQVQWTRVENRDPDKTYNRFAITGLDSLAPGYDWQRFLDGLGVSGETDIIVRQPGFMEAFGKMFTSVPLQDWKSYLTFKLLDGYADALSRDFDNLHFAFHGKTLSGTEKQQLRWKRAVDAIDGVLGEVVGKIYVEKHFPPQSKERMKVLVENLIEAYRGRIQQLDWMSADTKKQALAKLDKFKPKIGYPDKWRDYSDLSIDRADLVANMMKASEFEFNFNRNKLGQPVDPTEWGMTPQTVNAYYSATRNEVVFPAAILQPPFFNMEADDAVNYGGIGAVIGHEVTHGFDDQGSKYDGNGNLNMWWTEEDRSRFDERANKLAAQYETYSPIDTMHLNGKLTLGENIADLGGLTISYHAYQNSLHGKTAPVIDGFSGEQRFFMGWAQVWRRKYRDDELRRRVLTDPHSPSEYRVIGIVSNIPEFYQAFGVQEGDKLYRTPEERIIIW